jgi:hypothetical protein
LHCPAFFPVIYKGRAAGASESLSSLTSGQCLRRKVHFAPTICASAGDAPIWVILGAEKPFWNRKERQCWYKKYGWIKGKEEPWLFMAILIYQTTESAHM